MFGNKNEVGSATAVILPRADNEHRERTTHCTDQRARRDTWSIYSTRQQQALVRRRSAVQFSARIRRTRECYSRSILVHSSWRHSTQLFSVGGR